MKREHLGIIGYNGGEIKNCYSIARVVESPICHSGANPISTFWAEETSGRTSGLGTKKTVQEMKTQSTYI